MLCSATSAAIRRCFKFCFTSTRISFNNNNIIKSDYAEYNEKTKILKTKGPTNITTSENYLIEGNDKEAINKKINTNYEYIIKEINENSNVQIIIKNKKEAQVANLFDELIKDHKEQSNLKKIESLEQKLMNNLDENSFSELIKLKSQINRE